MRILILLLALSVSGTAFAQEQRMYAGTLNGTLKIAVYLAGLEVRTHADAISGSYQYAGKKDFLLLKGYANNAGNICLTEMATPNFSGVLLGTLVKNRISGLWISADGKKQLPFELVQMKTLPAEMARFQKGMEVLDSVIHNY